MKGEITMKLDIFENIKNTLDDKMEEFINDLSEYLNNSKEKETQKFTTLDEIEKTYKLNRTSQSELRKQTKEILQQIANEKSQDEPIYYISWKNAFKDKYEIETYSKDGATSEFWIEGSELPKNATVNDILKKENNKFVIDNDATSKFLEKATECAKNLLEKQEKNVAQYREEDCLYYVIDSDLEVVHLKNLNNNKIFEETNLPDDIKKVVFKDCILRYKNGKYSWDKELTDKYMKSFESI